MSEHPRPILEPGDECVVHYPKDGLMNAPGVVVFLRWNASLGETGGWWYSIDLGAGDGIAAYHERIVRRKERAA